MTKTITSDTFTFHMTGVIGIRTSIKNYLLASCKKNIRDMANRILEGVRRQCLRTKGTHITVTGPIGPMPALLMQLGFVPSSPLKKLVPKISTSEAAYWSLKDITNPFYALQDDIRCSLVDHFVTIRRTLVSFLLHHQRRLCSPTSLKTFFNKP